MTQVFRIREDVDRFATLVTDDESLFLEFDGTPKPDWSPPELVPFNRRLPRANFMYLLSGGLCFDETVVDAMGDILEMAGQVLSASLDGEGVYLLNVTEVCPALDEAATEWRISPRTGQRVSVARPGFRWDMFTASSVFKVDETCRAEIYTFVGRMDTGDEFVGRYVANGLTGLVFDLLDEDS